jgi:hypothetical protein
MSAADTLGAILPVLREHRGRKYCAPCLAKAVGIADRQGGRDRRRDIIRRVMDRASELPDLVVAQDACDTCHTVRRTLAAP